VQDQTPVFTLKVYTNLVQVPTLVLDHDGNPLPPIDFRRFQVSLDAGKKFAPRHVRMEGDDPLDLAILLDVTGTQSKNLAPNVPEAAATMVAKSLHPQDRVSIYTLSCNLLRTAYELPPDPERLRSAIQEGLQSPKLGKNNDGTSCGPKVYLWGALMAVIRDLHSATGRRALLVISDGRDDGSVVSWGRLHDYAGGEGVALFGLRDPDIIRPIWEGDRTDAFRSLCESTGGIVMDGGRRDVDKRMEQWVTLLRGRYVVEFRRPQQLSGREHIIQVSVKSDGQAFITLAGVSVTLPDPKITSDPNYVPSQEGADIPVGKRRPLPQ
jgi:VWFA-related protein